MKVLFPDLNGAHYRGISLGFRARHHQRASAWPSSTAVARERRSTAPGTGPAAAARVLTGAQHRAGEDLAVVAPPGPGGAAALPFGDVGGQHVVAEAGVVEVVVALLLLFSGLLYLHV